MGILMQYVLILCPYSLLRTSESISVKEDSITYAPTLQPL